MCVGAVKRSLKAMSLNENPPALFILSAAISDAARARERERDVCVALGENQQRHYAPSSTHTHTHVLLLNEFVSSLN